METLNLSILAMPRCEDGTLAWCGGECFPSHVHAQAKELRNMMQVHGISDTLCDLACRWVKLYMVKHRRNTSQHVTQTDLIEMDRLLLEFHELYQDTIAKYLPSRGNYIKYHKLAHFTTIVRRLGVAKHYNAQFFEAAHSHTKKVYQGTSKRRTTFIPEMVSNLLAV